MQLGDLETVIAIAFVFGNFVFLFYNMICGIYECLTLFLFALMISLSYQGIIRSIFISDAYAGKNYLLRCPN